MSKLTQDDANCFIYVVETSREEYLKRLLVKSGRDFDVLQEILGKIRLGRLRRLVSEWNSSIFNVNHISGSTNSQFFLESDHYVPERVINKLDKTTSSMMENGLHEFYLSLAIFKQKLIDRAYLEQIDDDFKALTAEQLKRPMIVLSYLLGVAMIIFITECIISKWKHRNRHLNSDNDF